MSEDAISGIVLGLTFGFWIGYNTAMLLALYIISQPKDSPDGK